MRDGGREQAFPSRLLLDPSRKPTPVYDLRIVLQTTTWSDCSGGLRGCVLGLQGLPL